MMSGIKSYRGGNDTIWAIHKLDILDKHRLLVPLVNIASIEGMELEDERDNIHRGGTWGTPQPPPFYVPLQVGWNIKKHGKVTLDILFDKRTPLHGEEVLEMLLTSSIRIFICVQLLEKLCE
jgi:hypothetical protein